MALSAQDRQEVLTMIRDAHLAFADKLEVALIGTRKRPQFEVEYPHHYGKIDGYEWIDIGPSKRVQISSKQFKELKRSSDGKIVELDEDKWLDMQKEAREERAKMESRRMAR